MRSRKLPTTAASLAAAALGSLVYAPDLLLQGAFWLALAALLAVLTIAHFLTRTEVDVGLDGVYIRRTFSSRFIDHDTIESFEQEGPLGWGKPRLVVLVLRTGERVELPLAGTQEGATAADSLLASIRKARARRRHDESHARSLVLPGDREGRAWLARLRSLSHRASYRGSIVAPEALVALVDDDRAPAAARAGAAIALDAMARGSGEADGMRQLRIAAEATANPTDRAALLRIADADDDALEGTLDELARAHREQEQRS